MQINSKLKSRSCVQIVSSVWICLSYPILINDMRRGLKEDGLDVSGFGDLEGGEVARRILGGRKLLVYVRTVEAAILDFMAEEDWGE